MSIEDQSFENIDYSKEKLIGNEFDNCTFNNCVFTDVDFSNLIFMECKFRDCDLSMMRLNNTSLKDVRFVSCKMLGLNFTDCNEFLFSVGFVNCHLNLSLFYQMKLKNTQFKNCNLQEVDFSETELSSVCFEECDLSRALFDRTILEKADFRSSYNYSIDPENNRIKKAKFSRIGIEGLLDKYNIDIQ